MPWEAVAHKGFLRDLEALAPDERERATAAVERLLRRLDATTSIDPRLVFGSMPMPPLPNLLPLAGSGVPGSYRLRAGRIRLALAFLPDERRVLLTTAARRDDATYRRLVPLHGKRFRDR